ncbi:helix-turn-helix domain-containing protein [Flavobacterium ammonificans]|jgi:AraC-like DNA-binding protein|uniref:helix-turn-helix domain-containing protein n=1 Tax=Flavobacterium ammonificans TaxID=1751056 RepID=UPI001E3406CC|nr:helix-turn-helix domain-containing protein [Flavobacterium ammonificans]BDB57563.1 transcriptional regulator [Flavobacterium ammonificans]
MLQTIQLIALIQGVFVLFALYQRRKDYKKITFWLLFGSLLSVLLYILGDDNNNLFFENKDWFLFDNTLFVTFLFLFFKYYKSEREKFIKSNYLFFLPNIFYLILELLEIKLTKENFNIEILEVLLELTFVIYLCLILYSVFTDKRRIWTTYFVIPIVILLVFSCINDTLKIIGLQELHFFLNQNFNTYLLLIVAFLFYFISLKLLTNNKNILPKNEIGKYNNSNLNTKLIEQYKSDLINAMEIDKLFLNGKLSIQDVSEKLNIPKQYISEVLNEHMNTNFQDFINEYRVEEFINRIKNDQNNQFTLLGIATEVGFNSKSSFNSIFKKFKGLTPTQFRKNLEQNG